MMALNRSVEFKSSNPKPSAAECFGTWGNHLSKLRRAQLCNPLYQILSIWAKWFWNSDFFHIAYVLLCFIAPGVRPFWVLWTWFEQTC